jgi:Protein of unknown function (DUF3102)
VTDTQKVLDTLAWEINTEHTACESAANAAVTHAMRAGGLLTEVKGRLSHGERGPWLVKNFAGSSRTARVYMRLHAHRDEIEAKRQSSATLSIDSALKALAAPERITRWSIISARLRGICKTPGRHAFLWYRT